jgi:hypothetical protein
VLISPINSRIVGHSENEEGSAGGTRSISDWRVIRSELPRTGLDNMVTVGKSWSLRPHMSNVQSVESTELQQMDIVAAIWILASNDENPEMTYRGLRHRLRLTKDVDERKLVADRRELFRLSIPQNRLDELKKRYREKAKILPSWLRELPEQDRTAAIEHLTVQDFFRSLRRRFLEPDFWRNLISPPLA